MLMRSSVQGLWACVAHIVLFEWLADLCLSNDRRKDRLSEQRLALYIA